MRVRVTEASHDCVALDVDEVTLVMLQDGKARLLESALGGKAIFIMNLSMGT